MAHAVDLHRNRQILPGGKIGNALLPPQQVAPATLVMDKHLSVGAYGPMYPEVCAAAALNGKIPEMYNFIYGLGGADTMVSDFMSCFKIVEGGYAKPVNYVGVKE